MELTLSESWSSLPFSSGKASDLPDSSVSERFRLEKPKPRCTELVRRRALSSSRLVLPCNFAPLAISFSSSNRRREEASSSVLMCLSEPSAKVKAPSSTLSIGGSASPGFSWASDVTAGTARGLSNSSTAADKSPMSP